MYMYDCVCQLYNVLYMYMYMYKRFSLYRDHVRNFFKSKSSEPVKYERVSCDSHVIVA